MDGTLISNPPLSHYHQDRRELLNTISELATETLLEISIEDDSLRFIHMRCLLTTTQRDSLQTWSSDLLSSLLAGHDVSIRAFEMLQP